LGFKELLTEQIIMLELRNKVTHRVYKTNFYKFARNLKDLLSSKCGVYFIIAETLDLKSGCMQGKKVNEHCEVYIGSVY